MSLNCAEITAILHELALEGAYIQKIIQPSYSTIALYIYKNKPVTLLICLEAGACRLHETHKKIPKTENPLRFMELLRSRIRGAKIVRAEQLHNNRIIRLALESSSGPLNLYIRLWSGAANIILTDPQVEQGAPDGELIIDAFYRRPARGEVSGQRWKVTEPPVASHTYVVREYDTSLSFNEAIDQWYTQKAPVLSLEALKAEAERFYALKLEKLARVLKKMKEKQATFLQADRLKHQGDMLLAHAHAIAAGSAFVELEDYEKPGSIVRITLDSRKTAYENASLYYEKYKKAVSGLEALTEDMQMMQRQITALTEELAHIRVEENPHVIEKILRKKKTPVQHIQAQQEKKRPGLAFNYEGWLLLVGRTAAENDELLRHHVRGKDMWLHVRDYAGGYVFIKNKSGKTVPLPVLIAAGNLAVFYSKARRNEKADLYYTAVKNIRRAKNAPKGTVLPSNEKNLFIKLDPAILKQLELSRLEEE
ncbi:MAG: NFACT RNA binding domain-containing protein [Treponema sp.]